MPNSNKPRPRKSDQVDILAAAVIFQMQTLKELMQAVGIEDEVKFAEMEQIGAAVIDKCARLYLPVEEIKALSLGKQSVSPPVKETEVTSGI